MIALVEPGTTLGTPQLFREYGIHERFEISGITSGIRGIHLNYLASTILSCLKVPCRLLLTRDLRTAAAGSVLRIPTLIEMHDLPKGRLTDLYFRWATRGTGFRGIAAITEALKNDLVERFDRFLSMDDVIVSPDGVELADYAELPQMAEAKAMLGIPVEAFVATYAGSFYSGKGMEVVLPLSERCRDVEFLVVGGEEHQVAEQRRRAAELNLSNIRLVGRVPPAEVPQYLAASDALLLPNQAVVATSSGTGNIGRYTSPLKLFEYLAMGRAILASDLPVLKEVLDESCAVFSPPDQIDVWAQHLGSLREAPRRRDRLRRAAIEKVQHFTWTTRAKQMLTFASQRQSRRREKSEREIRCRN